MIGGFTTLTVHHCASVGHFLSSTLTADCSVLQRLFQTLSEFSSRSMLAAVESKHVKDTPCALLEVAGGHMMQPITASFVLLRVLIVTACSRSLGALTMRDNCGGGSAGCGAIISVQQA